MEVNATATHPTASVYATRTSERNKNAAMTRSWIKDEARSPRRSHVRLQRLSNPALACSRWDASRLMDTATIPSARTKSNQLMLRRVLIVSRVKRGFATRSLGFAI